MGDVLRQGLLIRDTFEGAKTLSGSGNSDRYNTFQVPLGTNYQVPVGHKSHIGGIIYNSAGVKTILEIGYGDDTVFDSVTPPTNYVGLFNSLPVEVADRLHEVDIYAWIPPGKYPCLLTVEAVGNALLKIVEIGV